MDTFQGGILKQMSKEIKKKKKNAKNITLKKQSFFYSVVAYISLHIDTADTNVKV